MKKKKRLYDVNKVQEHKRKYLQTLSRAPQVGSWWRWGPRCRPCDPHTLWPAGTPLWTWSLWNWTQSDGNIKPMLTRTRKSQIIPDVSLTGFLHTSPSQPPPKHSKIHNVTRGDWGVLHKNMQEMSLSLFRIGQIVQHTQREAPDKCKTNNGNNKNETETKHF